MSGGQAPPHSAPPQDEWSQSPPPPPPTPEMPPPSAHTLLTNHSADVLRDGIPTSNASDSGGGGGGGGNYFNRFLNVNHTTPFQQALTSDQENYLRQKEEFYQSYDPQVGLHIAAVLGGILGWLIVYLLYKTKVKKWVLALLRKQYRKRKRLKKKKKKRGGVDGEGGEGGGGEDNADLASSSSVQPASNVDEGKGHLPHHHHHHHPPGKAGQRAGGGLPQPQLQQKLGAGQNSVSVQQAGRAAVSSKPLPPMPSIVVESYSSLPEQALVPVPVHKPSQGPPISTQDRPPDARKSSKNSRKEKERGGKDKRKKHRRKKGHKCPEVRVLDVDEAEVTSLLLPPRAQADTAQATARLVVICVCLAVCLFLLFLCLSVFVVLQWGEGGEGGGVTVTLIVAQELTVYFSGCF